MATWHQQKNKSAMAALYQPHATQWKCVSNKLNQMASSMLIADEAHAREYAKKLDCTLIAPVSFQADNLPVLQDSVKGFGEITEEALALPAYNESSEIQMRD